MYAFLKYRQAPYQAFYRGIIPLNKQDSEKDYQVYGRFTNIISINLILSENYLFNKLYIPKSHLQSSIYYVKMARGYL